MKLLVDAGNSRVKWAYWDGARLLDAGALAHAEIDAWPRYLRDAARPVDEAWLASVAGDARDAVLLAMLRAHTGREPRVARAHAHACGVRNAYADASQLGIDRFLALIAAHVSSPQATVIAACGTALALDAIDADGQHLGGWILPGAAMAQAALRAGAAQLAGAPDGAVADFAHATADAIASGAWQGGAAAIERFARLAAQRLATKPRVLLCGGDASRLGGLVSLPHRVEAGLVLRGLAHYADAAR